MWPATIVRRPRPANRGTRSACRGLRSLALALGAALVALAACDDRAPTRAQPPGQGSGAVRASAPTARALVERLELLGELPYCEVRHRGLSIDTGSSWGEAHRSFSVGPFSDVRSGRRAGHDTAEVLGTRLSYDFWLDRKTKGTRVALRVQGERSSHVAVYVDDRRVGGARLATGTSKVLDFGPLSEELGPGRHVVTLRFDRGRRGSEGPLALLDWLRVYLPDNVDQQYAAPTAANILVDVELSGQPRRSLALGAPGSVRCGLLPGPGTRVRLDVGYWGDGEASIEVRALVGHQKAIVLAERKVKGGENAEWTPLDLTLDAVGDELVVLEFATVDGAGTGRAVFGEPRLERTSETYGTLDAQNVVVVVGAGLDRDLIPPWAERQGLNHLFALSEEAVTFDGYRVTSTLVGGVVATLLTGTPAAQHGITHTAAGLAERVPMLSRAIREVGGRSAFFTNVPYTFSAFGFDRDFGEFDAISPVLDVAADEPLRRANRWLQKELEDKPDARRLLFVHVRGGHPPWDIPAAAAEQLPPSDYSGVIEPRRGAILLRQVSDRSRAASRRLGPRDWERLHALQRAALEKQDKALGRLIQTLQKSGQWQDTLFVYMGDVARGAPPRVPFAPYGPLREDRLSPPLIVKLPGEGPRGQRVSTPLGTLDLSRALHVALGIDAPDSVGPDMLTLANGRLPIHRGGLLAVHPPQYVFTVDRYRLAGVLGEAPTLCDIEVDPACQQDLSGESAFLMEWLWRLALRSFRRQGVADVYGVAEMAEIDEDTRAALTVFGL